MAKVKLHAYTIHEITSYVGQDGQPHKLISIALGIGTGPPIPDKVVEARKLSEVETALAAYADEARATGLKLQCHASMARGERSLPGFKKARLVIEVGV